MTSRKKQLELRQQRLDSLVCDELLSVAAEINNEGEEAQIDYLVSMGWTRNAVEKALTEEKEGKQ